MSMGALIKIASIQIKIILHWNSGKQRTGVGSRPIDTGVLSSVPFAKGKCDRSISRE